MAAMNVTVADNPEEHQYEARIDGELAGLIKYRIRPDARVFVHTVVLPEFEGKGVASTLAKAALDSIRAQGDKVVPSCPYVTSWLEKHPEYQDLVV
jgi:predicted GNAT family acetyltransferase